jgi:hypothetical protein
MGKDSTGLLRDSSLTRSFNPYVPFIFDSLNEGPVHNPLPRRRLLEAFLCLMDKMRSTL